TNENKTEDRVFERRRNPILAVVLRSKALFVPLGDPAFAHLVHMPDQRQGIVVGWFATRSIDAKHKPRSDIIGWGWQIDDEAARKQIVAVFLGYPSVVDQDVGERRCRVGDVGRARERS